MRRIDELFERYERCHRHPTNHAIHAVCVPLIAWSLVAMLWSVSPALAYATLAAALLYYAVLSIPIATGMLAVAPLLVLPAAVLGDAAGRVGLAVFVLAWAGQFWGHRIEGARPAFLDDLRFLLVGPAWLLAGLFRRVGLRW